MIHRLEELRAAVQGPAAEEGDEGEVEGPGVIGNITGYFRRNRDEQEKERKEMDKQFEAMMTAEQAVGVRCRDFHSCLMKLRETRVLERKAVLPEKLSQLENKLDSEEQQCQRLIKTVKASLEELRDSPKPGESPEKKEQRAKPLCETFQRVRTNWAQYHKRDYDDVVAEFFQLRSDLRQEQLAHTRRRLYFAYPKANELTIEEVLIYPQLAKMAIERRMECGEKDEPPPLEDVFDELAETKYSQEIKLAEETRELKILFVQFSEMVQRQGEALTAVEANISGTLEQMQEAVEHLEAAVDFKKEAQRLAAWRKFMLRMSLVSSGFFVLWMCGEPAWTSLTGFLCIEHLVQEEAFFVFGKLHDAEQQLAEATEVDTEESHLQLAARVKILSHTHGKRAAAAAASSATPSDARARAGVRHDSPPLASTKPPFPEVVAAVLEPARATARGSQRLAPLRRVQQRLAGQQAAGAVSLTPKGEALGRRMVSSKRHTPS